MHIGIPKEIKNHEYRVGLTPDGVKALTSAGHTVYVQHKAGHVLGYKDTQYKNAGATIVDSAADVYAKAELIVKVKEPQSSETSLLREWHVIFSYLHLAAEPIMTEALLQSGCIAVAFETITDKKGGLPLLAPMSAIAGRMATQSGIHYLETPQSGRGVLLGGVNDVAPGNVTIIGGGFVGTHAAIIAKGLGANVTILERSEKRMTELLEEFNNEITVVESNDDTLATYTKQADLLIGAILIPGASAPKIITKEHISNMNPGSVFVDVAIDQGGCAQTSKPTTHENPVYQVDDVTHFCVTNMPSAVARTATQALEHATLPYILELAKNGHQHVLKNDEHFRNGLNIYQGHVTYEAIANDLGHNYVEPLKII